MRQSRTHHLPAAALAASLLAAAGCAHSPESDSKPTDEPAVVSSSPIATPEAGGAEPEATHYLSPATGARTVAWHFATAFLSYDTRSENAREFLTVVRPFVTNVAFHGLAVSPRSELPWRSMKARSERVSFAITGTSSRASHTSERIALVINGIATTHTDLATLRNPVVLQLWMTRTSKAWKVAAVVGGGA